MELPAGARKVTQQGSTFYVVGDERHPLRDAYHTFLRGTWPFSLALLGLGFLVVNVLFALVYLEVGGVEGANGTFLDALSFSVQTMATVGYGVMHPETTGATTVMIFESMTGIIVIALATGLVFAKFSRPTTRVAFSRHAVITNHEGQRTLIFRVGNRRGNVIVEATLHVVVVMTTTTQEGETFYRSHDLKMVRDRQVGMTRGWTVMHVIDEASPLYGMDQAALAANEVEMYIALTGIDDITVQTVHSMHTYSDADIKVGYRLVDTLFPVAGGQYLVDQRNFHAIVPDTTPRDSVRA
jgi:inward rectifier potassium channel